MIQAVREFWAFWTDADDYCPEDFDKTGWRVLMFCYRVMLEYARSN